MKLSLQLITRILLIALILVSLVSVWSNFYLIYLNLETSKSITGTIIGASGAFIGFVVIYLSISFENFKKIYGQYAADFFGKDKLIFNLLLLFILPIGIGLLSYLISDANTRFSKFLFNISCSYFFLAIVLLIPYANRIIKKSLSKGPIENLINKLTKRRFYSPKQKAFKKSFEF